MHRGLRSAIALIGTVCLLAAYALSGPGAVASRPSCSSSAAAGPFGLCLYGRPHFECCSAAALAWSDIVAGSTIDIRGSVFVAHPSGTSVVIIGPTGARTLILVHPDGTFAQNVPFRTAGTYQIGIAHHGTAQSLSPFDVAWRYRVLRGSMLSQVFPAASDSWPRSDNIYLTTPLGAPTTFLVQLENAAGTAEPLAALTPNGPRANAAGVVAIRFPAQKSFTGPPLALAPGLYVQFYADIRPGPKGLVGFPGMASFPGVPRTVQSVTHAGRTYYSVVDFLVRMEFGWSGLGGPMTSFTYDRRTHELTVRNMNYGRWARIDSVTGLVQVEGAVWRYYGHVQPVFARGQVYLSLQDLIRIGNAIAWAAPDGHGGILFSNAWIP